MGGRGEVWRSCFRRLDYVLFYAVFDEFRI
jgi:hypothetical protein